MQKDTESPQPSAAGVANSSELLNSAANPHCSSPIASGYAASPASWSTQVHHVTSGHTNAATVPVAVHTQRKSYAEPLERASVLSERHAVAALAHHSPPRESVTGGAPKGAVKTSQFSANAVRRNARLSNTRVAALKSTAAR